MVEPSLIQVERQFQPYTWLFCIVAVMANVVIALDGNVFASENTVADVDIHGPTLSGMECASSRPPMPSWISITWRREKNALIPFLKLVLRRPVRLCDIMDNQNNSATSVLSYFYGVARLENVFTNVVDGVDGMVYDYSWSLSRMDWSREKGGAFFGPTNDGRFSCVPPLAKGISQHTGSQAVERKLECSCGLEDGRGMTLMVGIVGLNDMGIGGTGADNRLKVFMSYHFYLFPPDRLQFHYGVDRYQVDGQRLRLVSGRSEWRIDMTDTLSAKWIYASGGKGVDETWARAICYVEGARPANRLFLKDSETSYTLHVYFHFNRFYKDFSFPRSDLLRWERCLKMSCTEVVQK